MLDNLQVWARANKAALANAKGGSAAGGGGIRDLSYLLALSMRCLKPCYKSINGKNSDTWFLQATKIFFFDSEKRKRNKVFYVNILTKFFLLANIKI